MFKWLFERERRARDREYVHELLGAMFGPHALCEAINWASRTYVEACERGEISAPAIRRALGDPGGNVRQIWEDTRLEIALCLLFQEDVQLGMFASMEDQSALFESLRHQATTGTLCSNRSHDACARAVLISSHLLWTRLEETCSPCTLKTGRPFARWIHHAFVDGPEARTWIEAPPSIAHPNTRPPMLIELWWRETTSRSKEAAIAAIYGSDFRQAIRKDYDYMRRAGASPGDPEAMIRRIEAAAQPDDLYER